MKQVLAQKTSLDPSVQRLLFRGKEKDDHEYLHIAGVEDMSKLILMEDPASREKKLEEMKKDLNSSKVHESVSRVRTEVDKLYDQVCGIICCRKFMFLMGLLSDHFLCLI